jgi:allantoinase
VVWTEAARRGAGLDRVAAWMAAAPAALTGLADRGAISPGLRADLCVFAPDETFVVDPAALRHRNPVSPYAGHTLRGVVRQTWLAGRPAGPDQRTGQLASAAKRSAGRKSAGKRSAGKRSAAKEPATGGAS